MHNLYLFNTALSFKKPLKLNEGLVASLANTLCCGFILKTVSNPKK